MFSLPFNPRIHPNNRLTPSQPNNEYPWTNSWRPRFVRLCSFFILTQFLWLTPLRTAPTMVRRSKIPSSFSTKHGKTLRITMEEKIFIYPENSSFWWVPQGESQQKKSIAASLFTRQSSDRFSCHFFSPLRSGKGTHTPSILRARGITNPPISVSNLLDTPECKELINRGQMISDRTVMEMLFHALLDCDPTVGVLVDGFPRTEIQVEALRLFYDKMVELRREFWNTDRRDQFPRPVFRICVLYVDEDISVQRQLARGQMIRDHNAQVRRSGQGVLWEERVTDFDETVSWQGP